MTTRFEIEALQYVSNTGGGATRANLEEDFEPIGDRVWKTLSVQGWVLIDPKGRIFLTPSGIAALDASRTVRST